MTEISYRHQDGQNLAELRNYKLVQGQLFKINSKNHYRGVAPYPVATPNIGDTWEELGATGLWIESWFWNGSYWLSTNLYECRQFILSGNGTHGSFPNTCDFALNLNFNVYLQEFIVSVFQTTAGTATDYWEWTLNRTATPNSPVAIATLNSIGVLSSRMTVISMPLNFHIDVVATAMSTIKIIETRRAGNSAVLSTVKFAYRRARR